MSLSIVVVSSSGGEVIDILTSNAAAKKFVGQQLDNLYFTVSDLSSTDIFRHLTPLEFPHPVMDEEILLRIFNQDDSAIDLLVLPVVV
jgi:hypothetical protein